jgi:anthranilate synthase component 1
VPRAEFVAAVARAREYVAAGDCQQIVVSQRFDAETDLAPFEIYRALRRVNPSPYLFFVKDGDRALVGSSPETLVKLEAGEVTLRPIAGTRPRGRDAEEDARLEAELRADPKENAEHVMLVDLGRNDVGRVAAVGSVRVTQLEEVERYSHVMHLVSEVKGRLAEGLGAVDVLRAGFPAGTVTGSPKVRAMEIIDELEPARRGPYAGAVGYFDRGGDMEMCIAIRTLMARKGRVSAQSGAGIVYDSVPEAEYQETVNKARAVFTAVAQAEERLLAGRGEGASVRAERRRRGAAAGSRGSRAAAARSRSLRGKGSRR